MHLLVYSLLALTKHEHHPNYSRPMLWNNFMSQWHYANFDAEKRAALRLVRETNSKHY